ncbi:MAG TPA: DUF2851 family protein [Ignavibacteria bacterium]|nr:DUF2851 family protein [Ignavibacteria bacterium]
MKKLDLNESFISRIWENGEYYTDLHTTEGQKVSIINFGIKNFDSGADYKEAVVKIGETVLRGDVEIHRSMTDWDSHKHYKDKKYNHVVLQIVMWETYDGEIPKMSKSRKIPTVVLSKFLNTSVHKIWRDIINNPSEQFKIPCHPDNHDVNPDLKRDWIFELSEMRLKYKAERIKYKLICSGKSLSSRENWEQVFFELIAEALGYSKNKEQFLKLANFTKLNKIKKLNLNLIQIDSVLYGTAGFLKDLRFKDEYISHLKDNWKALNKKFDEVLNKADWNFFRLRPANFPTIRLAYLSGLVYKIIYEEYFKRVILLFEKSKNTEKDFINLFEEVEVSDYWLNHYNFGKETKKTAGSLIGKQRLTDIFINVVIPVIYLYAKLFEKPELTLKIKEVYARMKSGNDNEITRKMNAQLNFKTKYLQDEQGLIHLHNFYCIKGKCSECDIGKFLYYNNMTFEPMKIIIY